MSKQIEALKLALESLEDARTFTGAWPAGAKAIAAIKEAMAEQPAQPSKPWVGLSTDEIYDMYNEPRSDAEMVEFARAIESKLREKNA